MPREVISFPEILRAEAGYFTGICRRHHHLDGWQPAGATLSPGLRAANELSRAEERFDWLKMGGRRTDTPAYIDEFLDQVAAFTPKLDTALWEQDLQREDVQAKAEQDDELAAELGIPGDTALVIEGAAGSETLERSPSLQDVVAAIGRVR